MKHYSATFAVITLAACAPEVAVRLDPTKPYSENEKLISQCIAEADRKFPVDLHSYETEDYTPVSVTCSSFGSTTSCRSYGGYNTSRTVYNDMNETKAKAYFDSCMRSNDMPLVSLPYCLGVSDGEYCYAMVYPEGSGLYSGKAFLIDGNYWRRRYFMLGPNEMEIFQKRDGQLIPEQL